MLHTSSGLNLSADYIVCTNIVEPTTIILSCINIELNCEIFSLLDIELLNTVLTKNIKETTFRILTRNFKNIFLSHPLITCTSRNAATWFHNGDDFTC